MKLKTICSRLYVFCTILLAAAGWSEEPQHKPNIVFILADDLGWGDLGCYGNPDIKTPNLDALSKQGALFEKFFVSSPVCTPSRASFMTGRYPISVGFPHILFSDEAQSEKYGSARYLDPKFETIARILQRAGYVTAHFGKWHLGTFQPGFPTIEEYGFDFVRETGSFMADLVYPPQEGTTLLLPENSSHEDRKRALYFGKLSELTIDAAIDFIETNQNRPFFVNIWTVAPHAPLIPTKEQLDKYPGLKYPGYIPFFSPKHIYYASVTDLDSHIGRLMEKLRELGLEENTIVVFTSDNGPEDASIKNAAYSAAGSPGPFRGKKRSLYDGGVRVPFIVRWPGQISPGTINKQDVVANIDFLPTICSLAGVALPEDLDLDGEDRSAVLKGQSSPREKPLMWEFRSKVYARWIDQSPRLALLEVDGSWKFLMNPDGERVELYYRPHDLSEMNNIANENPERVERYKKRLKQFMAEMPEGPVQPNAGTRDLYKP